MTRLTSTNLTACSWGEGRIDVFGIDPTTGNIQQMYFENEGWNTHVIPNPFQGIETRFQGYITSCSWGENRIDIFGADSGGQLLHYYYDSGWKPGESLDKQGLTGQMTACSWGPNRIDIFGLNASRDRMIQYYFDGSWKGPISHDYTDVLTFGKLPEFAGAIACASWGSSRIDIFGQDSSGKMQQVYYDGGVISWHGAILDPTTSPTTAVISACAPGTDNVDTFWRDDKGKLQHYYYDGSWRPQSTIDDPFPGRNWTLQTASSWGKYRIDLFGIDDAGKWLHFAHGWVPEVLS